MLPPLPANAALHRRMGVVDATTPPPPRTAQRPCGVTLCGHEHQLTHPTPVSLPTPAEERKDERQRGRPREVELCRTERSGGKEELDHKLSS